MSTVAKLNWFYSTSISELSLCVCIECLVYYVQIQLACALRT